MDPQNNSTTPSDHRDFDTTHSLLNSSTFLLHLIEPVRIYKSPLSSSVNFSDTGCGAEDNNSSEKLKRRLIDALAFICATERDGDSGAAICIEETIAETEGVGAEDLASEHDKHGEYTLRIAKNGWVGEEVLQGMRDIVKSLEAFAEGSQSSTSSVTLAANLYQQTDAQVYSTIISLHLSKVLYHLSEIRGPITLVQEALQVHLSAGEDDPQRITALLALTSSDVKKLQIWLRAFVAQVVAADEAGEKQIPINAVTAAYQVRRSPVFGHLEALCKSVGCQVVGVHMIKLGRYKAACRTLVHACQKWPGLFVGMKVEGVPEAEDDVVPNFNLLPRPTREMEIRRTVAEIIQGDDIVAVEAAVEESVQALLPTISEEQFTTAWASRVAPCTGHAEIRLVEFYEDNCKRRPISGSTDPKVSEVRYIGMSKKPCYLCQMFVDRHPTRYMLGGLEGEKPWVGVKRVLDPCWRLRPVAEQYAHILDEMREAVEQELRTEVEKWVIRGSDEEVLGRERPRGRAKAKGKRVPKRGKPKLHPDTSSSSNASSTEGGGTSLTAEGVHESLATDTTVKGLAKARGEDSDAVIVPPVPAASIAMEMVTMEAVSEDEGEGVKLVHLSVEGGVSVEDPDLIFPTAETGPDALKHHTDLVMIPPPPRSPSLNLIDDEPEFLPLSSATLSAVEFTSIAEPSPTVHNLSSILEQLPMAPNSAEFHSETQFIEESEFRLLSPIPEEDESLVLVNLESFLVRLADVGEEDKVVPQGEEGATQATELSQRARALSDVERDLLGLDFTLVTVEEAQGEVPATISIAPKAARLNFKEYTGHLAPGGYLVPDVIEEGCSIAPGGYFVVEAPEESNELPPGGYYVIAAEQAGVVLPGGYLAAEAKVKEAGAFAPGGYLVAEMKGEVEIATLMSDESAEAPIQTVPQQPPEGTAVTAELRTLAPGGYIVTSHEDGVLATPGGYFVAMSEDQENAGCIPSDQSMPTSQGDNRAIMVSRPLPTQHVGTQSRFKTLSLEDVTGDSQVAGALESSIRVHVAVAVNEDKNSPDTDASYDVINIEQERERRAPLMVTEQPVVEGIAGPTNMKATIVVPGESNGIKSTTGGKGLGNSSSQLPCSSETNFSPLPPIAVPTAEKIVSIDAGSHDIDAIVVTSSLGSSPSSSTHTTLSTSTTLANNSNPTTPRLRSAALLFSPSLRRASTWAPPTTATFLTNTPAITSNSLSEDSDLLPDSRPGTAMGDMEDSKAVTMEIRSGGWLAKRLMRAAHISSGTKNQNMEARGAEAEVLPRRGSFSSTRPSTPNGDRESLTGTAKALLALRALHTQVRQKK